MDLRRSLRRWAYARPRVLVTDMPGHDVLRWQVEAELDRRSWAYATSPADTDVLIVLGEPTGELSDAIDLLWSQVPTPRHTFGCSDANFLSRRLDQAIEALANSTTADANRQTEDDARARLASAGLADDADASSSAGQDMGGHAGDDMGGHAGDDMGGHAGQDMDEHAGHDMGGHAGHDMSGEHTGHDMGGHMGHDMGGHAGQDMDGHAGHDMGGHTGHDMDGHAGDDMSGEHTGHDMGGRMGHDMGGHTGDDMSGEHTGHDMGPGHDMGGHAGHDMSGHMGHDMSGPVAGLPMAQTAQDRDGLDLDVLSVALGPVLPGWPTGLVLRAQLQGDVIIDAQLSWTSGADNEAGDIPGPAQARALDHLARFLVVAGWPTQARQARQARSGLTSSDPAVRARAQEAAVRVARGVRHSRTLAWSVAGMGHLTDRDPERPDDVLARIRRWCDIAAGTSDVAEPGPVALPTLASALEGSELATARLVVASVEPKRALTRVEGVRTGA
ncbi:hypothetical protein [Modestobacter altitudinis]|uniref:hypothetical protein n=1 Tax=Modestobacter altitudinis TaxID=2213158 RepID=UPI00110CFB2E|nr:hypothetical protein [Modestobacter altitudinis]